MEKNLFTVQAPSSLTDFVEVSPLFDKALIRICYTGLNRNGSFISEEVLEKALETLPGVPVVANYDPVENTIGYHDIKLVETTDGKFKVINETSPIGCVYPGGKVWIESDPNDEKSYLLAEVLLWKRQPAYEKIAEDKMVMQSMEIVINNGELIDGIFYIKDFSFSALCLLGNDHEPCFEGASLQLFSMNEVTDSFKKELGLMITDIKESMPEFEKSMNPIAVHSLGSDESKESDTNSTKGENDTMNKNKEVFEIEKDIENKVVNEQEETEELKEETVEESSEVEEKESEIEEVEVVDAEVKEEVKVEENTEENAEVSEEAVEEEPKTEEFEIDNEEDYKEEILELIKEIEELRAEIEELRAYKSEIEKQEYDKNKDELLAAFADLQGVDLFEELVSKASDYTIEELEEKLYAVRGRTQAMGNFTLGSENIGSTKIKVVNHRIDLGSDPYGNIVEKYKNKKY